MCVVFISCSWCPSHTQVESDAVQTTDIQWSLYKMLCVHLRICATSVHLYAQALTTFLTSYFPKKTQYITVRISSSSTSSYRSFVSVSVEITRMGTTSECLTFIYLQHIGLESYTHTHTFWGVLAHTHTHTDVCVSIFHETWIEIRKKTLQQKKNKCELYLFNLLWFFSHRTFSTHIIPCRFN